MSSIHLLGINYFSKIWRIIWQAEVSVWLGTWSKSFSNLQYIHYILYEVGSLFRKKCCGLLVLCTRGILFNFSEAIKITLVALRIAWQPYCCIVTVCPYWWCSKLCCLCFGQSEVERNWQLCYWVVGDKVPSAPCSAPGGLSFCAMVWKAFQVSRCGQYSWH